MPTLAALATFYLDSRPHEVGKLCVSERTKLVKIDDELHLFQVTLYRRTARHFAELVDRLLDQIGLDPALADRATRCRR